MKKFLILPMFLVIAVLSSCGAPQANSPFGNLPSGNNTVNTSDMEKPDTTGKNVSVNECITSCSVLESGTGLISRETCESGCWMEEAKNKKDASLCLTKVQDTLFQSTCLVELAKETADVSICDKIGENAEDAFRGTCYMAIAEKNKDVSICEAIKGNLMYLGCVEATKEGAGE